MSSFRTIAVSGAGGFVGTAAIEAFLREKDVAVRALYSRPVPGLPATPRHVPFVGELADASLVDRWLEGASAVVHLANRGYALDQVAHVHELIAMNLGATGHVVEGMRRRGIRRLVFASTGGGMYRATDARVPFTETSPVEARSPYALYKLSCERLLEYAELAMGLSPVILRISNTYGPGQFGRTRQGIVGVAFHKALAGLPLPVWGSLATAKDFVYIGDTVEAIRLALSETTLPGGLYNVGSGEATPLSEVIRLIEAQTGRPLELALSPAKAGDTPWTALDTTKLGAFGWAPRTSLAEGIARTWADLQARGLARAA